MVGDVNQHEIVFFDLETTIPYREKDAYAILEFGSITLCPKKLTELGSYETLVRPTDMSLISRRSMDQNGITPDDVLSMPTFEEIADRVYNILHGRVWAGHDISRFDCVRLREAFAEIKRPPPQPKRIIDTLVSLTQKFGRRAGNMKLKSLAAYFGLGRQSHRSLGDVRMNFEVVKFCAAVLFLEPSQPDTSTENNGASLNAVNGYRSNGNASLEGSALNTSPFPSNRNIENVSLSVDEKVGLSVDKMKRDPVQSNEANMISGINQPEIVFFDLETTIPVQKGQPYAILEFGSILLCPKKLTELESYETLVKPLNMSLISITSISKNSITQYNVLSMPTFAEIADRVYNILHGRVWAGHDISRFDCERLKEAYAQINRPPPEPKRIIDTLVLLTEKFGRRAGNMKVMANLAAYFGLGRQSHRSLGDARMNLEVVKCCATVLFLESSQQDSFTGSNGASVNAGNGERLEGDHVQTNEAMVKEASTTTLSDTFSDHTGFAEPASKKARIKGA
ncbi:Exonuclease [Artemisia annua]|uniref:Exonuclease n=1 Tax=Artemisia annua TaxID=35608 RepID=A0A2U1L976_ARTAN|nr:Exonuclease [Artemisia annua]